MIPHFRKLFNEAFTEEKYQTFLKDLNAAHPGAIEFRVAETPVFVPDDFRDKMISACESIVDIITAPGFKKESEKAIPPTDFVKGDETHPHFIAFDFGVCINSTGALEPQLIEMQGFIIPNRYKNIFRSQKISPSIWETIPAKVTWLH